MSEHNLRQQQNQELTALEQEYICEAPAGTENIEEELEGIEQELKKFHLADVLASLPPLPKEFPTLSSSEVTPADNDQYRSLGMVAAAGTTASGWFSGLAMQHMSWGLLGIAQRGLGRVKNH